ncbi:MAG: ribonuclease Y, partial [Candidatus Aeolococcus gillhamiae]
MAIVAVGLSLAVAIAAVIYARRAGSGSASERHAETARLRDATSAAEQERASLILAAREEALRLHSEAETEARDRRTEMVRLEKVLAQRDESLDRRIRDVEQGEQRLERREEEFEELRVAIETERSQLATELERVAGLSQEEAPEEVLADVEGGLSHEIAERIRAAEIEVHAEAAERSRDILITAMQRHASEQTGEAAVTVLHLPSDELKGRIIGREGRNIRALEAATGVDLIIDDTPEAVILSGFDPVRREVARLALTKLILDGRIHPTRIEDVVAKAQQEVDIVVREAGEHAALEANVHGLQPDLLKILG